MLVLLGFAMIAVFMVLIMTKKLTPVLALIIVPTVFGLFAGAGLGIGPMVMDSMKSMTSTAALLMFAIIYFGLMIDVGLFDPLVKFILRKLGNDPAKVVLGTAILAAAVSLDGDGSTTFILTTAAMLPVYLRLKMSPVVLTCVAGLANGTMNILPWGGPTARAATALKLDVNDVFVPMVPSLIVGLIVVLVFSWLLGLQERNRLRTTAPEIWGDVADPSEAFDGGTSRGGALAAASGTGSGSGSGKGRFGFGRTAGKPGTGGGSGVAVLERPETLVDDHDTAMADTALDPNRTTLRPKLFWFNLGLTVAVMVTLVANIVPLPFVFMVGSAIALLVNFPKVKDQGAQLIAHAPSIVAVVSMVMAAAVLTGVLNGTGMVKAMSEWLVQIIPADMGPFMAVITGLLSIPMTFFMSNDAFYFGVLPVLSETAAHYGVGAADMARASITGQPFHLQSPLVPAILLLVSLAKVDLGDHHKKVLWRTAVISIVMLAVGVLTGAIGIG
ncbi:citrate:proton symporter [Arthrobacter sp. StoSoilB3]|uniref:CitMHS family transporter n=2 Tax=Paenarthrobacter nicotinovorans TaxID=29320 RepID=UPI0006F94E7E|nr:CitMHS family transporter [Paenarthrobacter nicotinovorans]KQR01631.1 citrate:proton symporter [Arthrobacter sp. Leaf145]BCW10089.1 citrate:proton symporter [Arthrobacter sp. NtRootA2]BCW14169.1 citrate:proton symporter [Arthrobacter sp. NtRootA4]BCW22505.1 citrate:proton symporter [Arthrobacter sp. NtRootC7]BCW26774.1 citrate:proton symporter [Arthrobacter sp. NtRootC45]BCW31044.1 citrate:proton symporter [Arthrobacter sp. NtRootD5]BCW39853.1 citrate:proton symporter [Arthrobacter sp. St